MSKKKYEPRRPAGDDRQHHLDAEPARDFAALLVPTTSIIPSRENVRSDLPSTEELAASLREHGMLQPITVVRAGGGFMVVAGNRRLAAAQLAGLEQVPVRVLDLKDDRIAVIQLVENLQREQLDGAAEVRAVASLLPAFGGGIL